MENKENSKALIFRIIYCVGALAAICYVFFTIDSDLGSMWTLLTDADGKEFLSIIGIFEDSEFMAEHPVILMILMYWLPALLVIASAALLFAMRGNKSGHITGTVGIVIFIIFDILMIANDISYAGVYVNLLGAAIAAVGIIMLLSVDENKKDLPEPPAGGEIRCISGEFSGGVFYCNNVMIIGRSADGCNLILNNGKISRIHCIITYIPETDTYTVKDTSKNGTFFGDGQRLVKDFEMQVPRKTEIYMGEPKERFILD